MLKNFLPKKNDGEYRVRPWRTVICCVLIAVMLVTVSVGMSYSKFNDVSAPLSTTYQVKEYILPSDYYVTQNRDYVNNTGVYYFDSPDGNVRVAYTKQSDDPGYLTAEYLAAFFNPQLNTIKYTSSSNQIQMRYEIGLSGVNHEHPLKTFGLKARFNNQARGIVVYLNVGADVDLSTINGNSLKIQYVYSDVGVNVSTSSITSPDTLGMLAIGSFGQLYRISTDDELLLSRFSLNYDKKGWAAYADTSWYDDYEDDTEFIISTPAELAGLAQIVNAGTDSFVGKTIKLSADISLADANGYLRKWTPIGTYEHLFKGSFDGQDHTISGLNVADFGASGNTAAAGLFGYVSGDATATIKDLTIDTAYVSAELYEDLTVTPSSARNSSGAEGTLVGRAEGYIFSGITIKNANVCGIALCGGGMIGRCNANTQIVSCNVDPSDPTAEGGFAASGRIVGFVDTPSEP